MKAQTEIEGRWAQSPPRFLEHPGLIYGICVVCRRRTPLERLAAIPATSLCLDCAVEERPSPL